MPEATTSKYRIDIISPIPGKGLGRQYKAAPEITDESNYIVIGAVIYDANGAPVSNADMSIGINSETPVVLHGTGDVTPIYVDGQKRVVPVYTVTYEFKTAGDYTFTFSSNDVEQSVTVTAN